MCRVTDHITLIPLAVTVLMLAGPVTQGLEDTSSGKGCTKEGIPDDLKLIPLLNIYTSGSVLNLTCQNENLTLIGQSQVLCTSSGDWSSVDWPDCQYIVCPTPEQTNDARMTVDIPVGELKPGVRLNYKCLGNTVLVGNGSRACLINATWSDALPQCLGDCGPLLHQNASVEKTCSYEGCVAKVTCDNGFVMSGEQQQQQQNCSEDRTWSPDITCERVYCVEPNYTFVDMVSNPVTSGLYEYGTNLTYTCKKPLLGNGSLWCSEDATWQGSPPQCKVVGTARTASLTTTTVPRTADSDNLDTVNASTVSLTTTTVPRTVDNDTSDNKTSPNCPSPEHIPSGSYKKSGKTLLKYSCDHGFKLMGDQIRSCLSNDTWSGISPRCVPISNTTIPKPNLAWKTPFIDYKTKDWQGFYIFRGERHKFKLRILKVNVHPSGNVTAIFDDKNAKLDVSGYSPGDDVIVFHCINLLISTSRFADRTWSVRGRMSRVQKVWTYKGNITSSVPGFTTLTMTPMIVTRSSASTDDGANITALALGITIAVCAIVLAAVMTAYCMKRKSSLRAAGHQTLTSFENPVYEYENSLK